MKLVHMLGASAVLSLAACGDQVTNLAGPVLPPGGPTTVITASAAEVVMNGLDSPRGLAFGPEGALYVAEAGRGGPGPCYIIINSQVCYGPTGAVSRLWHGRQERVVTGLPSVANRAGRAEGPNGIGLLGLGGAYVAIGLEGTSITRDAKPEFAGFGRLVHISPSALGPGRGTPHSGAKWEFVADLAAYETSVNPDCGNDDSNPFSLLVEPGGVIIVDAGANTLLRRSAAGELSTFVSLPSRHTKPTHADCPLPAGYPTVQPRETVPTSVVRGPDGAYYIGQLAGFPIVVGAANVYRVVPGSAPEVFLKGFTFIVSLAFDDAGNLYVLQYTDGPAVLGQPRPGSLTRVAPDGSRTRVLTDLMAPTSVAIGPDGGIYVSNKGNRIGEGEVLRIDP